MEPITNGCDFWFDGNWKTCCDLHDIAFQQPNSDFMDWTIANADLVACIFPISPINAIIVGTGTFIGSWMVFNFRGLKGKTLWEILTGKRYNGPQG